MPAAGLALIAAGDFLAATLPVADHTLTSLVLPLGLVGIGFAFSVSSVTATAVNTVPVHLAGMASASTSLLRDFGFPWAPRSSAPSRSAGPRRGSPRTWPPLTANLATAPLSPVVKAAARHAARLGGPLAVDSVPPESPPGGAAFLALKALGQGYSVGFVVCGAAALFSCLLVLVALRGGGMNDAQVRAALVDGEEPAA